MVEKDDKNRFSDSKQEAKLEDLAVEEIKEDEVRGGTGIRSFYIDE